MKLYHGSNQIIKTPDLNKSRKFLDFGSGFYLSTGKRQAENRAKSAMFFFEAGNPTINIYEFDETLTGLNILEFKSADIQWLNFVIANRKGEYVSQYDIVTGPTANDKTILTIDQYMQGMYDHLANPKEIVIQLLRPEKLETQYLFITVKAISCLNFIEAYEL